MDVFKNFFNFPLKRDKSKHLKFSMQIAMTSTIEKMINYPKLGVVSHVSEERFK